MEKLKLILLLSNLIYAGVNDVDNAWLFTVDNTNCIQNEDDLYNLLKSYKSDNNEEGFLDRVNPYVKKLNQCLSGETYYDRGSSWSNSSNESDQTTLGMCGQKYKVNKFQSVNEINDGIKSIRIQLQNQDMILHKVKLEQEKQNEILKENQKRIDSCEATFQRSAKMKKYNAIKNRFIKNRYLQCINNGYNTLECWTYKLQDSIGYGLEKPIPESHCK